MAAAGLMSAISKWLPLITAGTQAAGAIGAGRAQGRAAENTQTISRDQVAQDRYRTEQAAKLGAASLTEEATQDRADRHLTSGATRAQQAGLGDLLANLQDVKIGGLPSYIPNVQISGGLRPSAFGANTREAGRTLSRDALEAMLSGSDVPDLPDTSGLGTDAPELSALAQSGKLDSILSTLGMVGLGTGTYSEIKRQQGIDAREQARLDQQAGEVRLPTGSTPIPVVGGLPKAPAATASASPRGPLGSGMSPEVLALLKQYGLGAGAV